MKGSDLISILEYAKTFNKPQKEPKKKVRKMKDDDVVTLFQKKLQEAEMLKKFLEEREKINKKEEKKEEKKSWDASTIAIWLVLSFPITGPLYLKFLTVMIPGIMK